MGKLFRNIIGQPENNVSLWSACWNVILLVDAGNDWGHVGDDFAFQFVVLGNLLDDP
jgi:hypothetical protein